MWLLLMMSLVLISSLRNSCVVVTTGINFDTFSLIKIRTIPLAQNSTGDGACFTTPEDRSYCLGEIFRWDFDGMFFLFFSLGI